MNNSWDILDGLQAYVEGIQESEPTDERSLHECDHFNKAWALCKQNICELVIERIQMYKRRIQE